MKLLHIADLHIGKRVNEFNMIEDQVYILDQILNIVEEEKPQGILLAGDIYDKSQPSAEAVELLDEFLTKLVAFGQPVYMISGNHDSPERLGFGSRIMQKHGLHIAGIFEGKLRKETIQDENGPVNIYLLPYLKPAIVKPYFKEEIESYDDAVRIVIGSDEINTKERNILLAHQFITSGMQQPEQSDSESISVGGLDNVDVSVFEAFDYVALGHLHRPQRIGRDTVRYAGSPLKYSFSEARYQKSATMLELGAKGEIHIKLHPLIPLHDMREIKGPIAELLSTGKVATEGIEDYIHAIVTDEEEIYDAIGQLRQVYPNLMVLNFDNSRNKQGALNQSIVSDEIVRRNPLELFSEFFQKQNNIELSPAQTVIMKQIFEQAGGALI